MFIFISGLDLRLAAAALPWKPSLQTLQTLASLFVVADLSKNTPFPKETKTGRSGCSNAWSDGINPSSLLINCRKLPQGQFQFSFF
jgi:hypothetical protein